MGILDSLSRLEPEALQALIGKIDENTAAGLLPAIHAEINKRCSTDGLYWLSYVSTVDEADRNNPVKPFPLEKEYISALWKVLTSSKRVVLAKSRQMTASWLMCAYCVWQARYHPHTAIYWQAQKDDDANSMVALPGQAEGRMQFIESHLPGFLRQKIKTAEGRIVWPNASFVQALAGGANQIRGRVFSVYVGDEFAFQEEARGVYTAIAPLLQKGSQIVLVSTPNGGPPNTFASLFHGVSQSDARE